MKTSPEYLQNIMLFARTLKEHIQKHHHDEHEGQACHSFLQFKTLALISERKNPSMQEIASLLYISPPSASELVTRLIRHGELTKTKDTKDKRIIRLSITSKGKGMLKKRIQKIMSLVEPMFEPLTQEEKKTLNILLKKIIKK